MIVGINKRIQTCSKKFNMKGDNMAKKSYMLVVNPGSTSTKLAILMKKIV